MAWIGRIVGFLEGEDKDFVVEALAKVLRPEWIQEAVRDSGRESVRVRSLPADFMVWFVILLGLFRRVSYANLLEKVDETWWTKEHWSPLAPPCTSAVTKARDRLGVEPMQRLFDRSGRAWLEETEGLLFHGRRVYAIDGLTLKTPDSDANREYFGLPGATRGQAAFPQMRALGLLDVGTRLLPAMRWGPYSAGEVSLARDLVVDLAADSVVLLDRNFIVFDFLWDVHQRGADFVVRLKRNNKFQVLEQLGPGDALVEVTIGWQPRRKRPDLPKTWILRQIEHHPKGAEEPVRLLTTFTDASIVTRGDLIGLYPKRWEEEIAIDELKTHQCGCSTVNHPVVFRSRKPERVVQELYGLLIGYNAVHRLMAEAAPAAHVTPSRLSFTAALERTREAIWDMMRLSTRSLPDRYKRLLEVIRRARLPLRPPRSNPREVRVKMSKYRLKRRNAA